MLVAVAAFWKWYGRLRREPDEITKMIIGSVFTIAGGLCLFMAALTQPHGGKISLFWPMMFELCNSIGFAHVLPISLALFSKIAPKQITATVIGLYYLAFFIANAARRLCRRPLLEPADDHLLADPRCQRGIRSHRFRHLQARARSSRMTGTSAGAGRALS